MSGRYPGLDLVYKGEEEGVFLTATQFPLGSNRPARCRSSSQTSPWWLYSLWSVLPLDQLRTLCHGDETAVEVDIGDRNRWSLPLWPTQSLLPKVLRRSSPWSLVPRSRSLAGANRILSR
jgi:hypothetical protein